MKRLLFIVLLFLVGFGGFGQRVPETNKNEWGVSFGIMAYQARKFNITPANGYSSISTNVSPDVNFKYRRRFAIDSSGFMFLESGVGSISRFSDVPVDTVAIRMKEEFYDVPISFGIAAKASKYFGFSFTCGLKFAVLSKQDFYTQPSTAVSPFSGSSFGDYFKWGYGGDFTFNVYFHKRSIFSIGFYTIYDFSSPITKKSTVDVTSAYRAYGMYWGFGWSF